LDEHVDEELQGVGDPLGRASASEIERPSDVVFVNGDVGAGLDANAAREVVHHRSEARPDVVPLVDQLGDAA
jgi:hypothetical protein